jgi:hypothetical protein
MLSACAAASAPLAAAPPGLPAPEARERMAPGGFLAARVEPARELSFGAIIASAEPLVVTLSPDGRLTCPALRCIGNASPGEIAITGADSYLVSITVTPAALVNAEGDVLRVRPLLAAETLTLQPGNRRNRVGLGGTLSLGARQAPGDYRGEYLITVDYL